MQGLLLAVGILLAGQLGDAGDSRYEAQGGEGRGAPGAAADETFPWDDETATPLSGLRCED